MLRLVRRRQGNSNHVLKSRAILFVQGSTARMPANSFLNACLFCKSRGPQNVTVRSIRKLKMINRKSHKGGGKSSIYQIGSEWYVPTSCVKSVSNYNETDKSQIPCLDGRSKVNLYTQESCKETVSGLFSPQLSIFHGYEEFVNNVSNVKVKVCPGYNPRVRSPPFVKLEEGVRFMQCEKVDSDMNMQLRKGPREHGKTRSK